MKFKADEIASVLQQEIEDFQGQIQTAEVGRVVEVGDGIARIFTELTAGTGQPDTAIIALQQGLTQFILQSLYGPADGGHTHVQQFTTTTKIERIGYGEEDREGSGIHP